MPPDTPDIFDQWASTAQGNSAVDSPMGGIAVTPGVGHAPPTPEPAPATPGALRRAVQELLKHGLLEQSAKPHLFRHIATDTARVNALLEPLDLSVRLDDHRGLAFVAIAATYQADGEDEDEWTHPLVRRQRLTLEQSLLLALLRREFLQREQESGLGVPVHLSVDSLLPQLEIYLGSTGSDMHARKRLLNLLENLRGHGVVSEVDAQDSFTIRPMIVHLANPENLQALLHTLREMGRTNATAAGGSEA
jgi:hypothetical protein